MSRRFPNDLKKSRLAVSLIVVMLAGAHVVIFSELSPKSKVQYTRFLLDHDVKVRLCRRLSRPLLLLGPTQLSL